MKWISELSDGDHGSYMLLVASADPGVTSVGKRYLRVTLQDASGSIEGKKWEVADDDLDVFVPGNIVMVDGEVLNYRGLLQMKIVSGSMIPQDGLDITRFVASAPVSKEILQGQFEAYLDSIKIAEVKALVAYFYEKFHDLFLTHPAAVRNHHNYASGLLYHTVSMANLAESICKLYPTLNRDILIGGVLLHDMGKTIELTGPIGTSYTTEGNLIGHISIMQAEIREASHKLGLKGEIPMLLEHMVLSHHTKPEFGSPIPPETREAVALGMIDDFDAKMAIIDNAEKGVEPGSWTQKVFAMDGHLFYVPLYDKPLTK